MPRLKDVVGDFDGRDWLEVALDEYDQTTLRPSKVRDYFSPSSAHWCPRAIWYYMKGYDQDPVKANSLRRMMTGTVYHEFVEQKLKGAGILVSSEEEVTWDDPPIVGHYDAIIERTTDKKHILLEIKSMADPKNKKSLQYLPRHEHLLQWNLYSLMTDIDEGIIFYVNKNSQDYMIFPVERNNDIIENTLTKLRKVKKYLDEGKMIPYLPDENHSWCNFQATCERDHFVRGV